MSGQTVDERPREVAIPLAVKFAWVVVTLGLILARIIWPQLNIDSIALGLLVLAGLPWFYSLIESAKLPGGIEIKMWKLETKVEEQEEELKKQQEIINQLVVFSMSGYIFDHLAGIYYGKRENKEYRYRKNNNFDRDLRYLIDNGYLKDFDYYNLPDYTDLAKVAELTPVGSFLVEQRLKQWV